MKSAHSVDSEVHGAFLIMAVEPLPHNTTFVALTNGEFAVITISQLTKLPSCGNP